MNKHNLSEDDISVKFITKALITRGNAVTSAMVDGKPVTIGLNAYIKP